MPTGMRGFWPAELKGQTTKEVSLTARDQLEVQFRSHSDFMGLIGSNNPRYYGITLRHDLDHNCI